jgi:hypothetical protein
MKYSLLFLCIIGNVANAQFITNNGIDIVNTTLLTTNGDWTNDGIIVNDGTIVTTENWTNTGTLADTSTGGFVLKYTVANTFIPGGTNFGYLEVDGSDVNIGLRGELTLKDSLILKDGVLRISAEPGSGDIPVLTVDAGIKIVAGSTSFVDGMMSRKGDGNLFFPLGINEFYLPVTLHKVAGPTAQVTVSVADAPTGYSAGPGVDALIDFPYVWIITKNAPTDTATYIEINYPNTLPVVSNPIVAREAPGLTYKSMGARLIDNSNGRIIVKSYSRGLTGSFTVAQGFPGNLETDSLALVALYNSTGGESWTTKTNWLSNTIDTWSGITLIGQSIIALDLSSNNLTGAVPEPVVDINALQSVNLSDNNITAIPDFTGNEEITLLNVSDNNLDFASLEPNANVPGIVYNNQAELGTAKDSLIAVGSPVDLTVNAGGASSAYQWKRNDVNIAGANAPVYSIASIDRSNMGQHIVEVTNPLLPELTLKSAPHNILAYANLSGTLFAEPTIPASTGTLTLFRVTTAAYDTIASVDVQNDGSYNFEKVVLDDYQLLGFADTIVYNQVLPTYYQNTIFWEEADTLFLENNLNGLDITSTLKPSAPSGRGSISGYFEEDDGTTGGRLKKTLKPRRVSGAGVSARKVERTGRGKEEILTLVAHVFTDENGEFTLPNLPTGEYRINIQYPGYPMDETSFITIIIGEALQSQVSVEAKVENGKINVRKRVITGINNSEDYKVDVYPNPAVDIVHLKFGGKVKGRVIALMDSTGKMLTLTPAENKEEVLNVQQLNNGIYFLHINEKGTTLKTLKLSIE